MRERLEEVESPGALSLTLPFLHGPVFFHLERDGMPLHNAVG